MVHGGAVLRGTHGNAGELGHLPLVLEGDLCPCGNRGCLERYLSMEAYERRGRTIGEDAWIAEVAPLLQSAVVTIENLYDPEVVIFGGVAAQQQTPMEAAPDFGRWPEVLVATPGRCRGGPKRWRELKKDGLNMWVKQ